MNRAGDTQLAEAGRLFRAGLLPQAEALCRAFLAGHPRDPDALYLLGALADRKGDPGEAERLFAQAALVKPSADFHFARGFALQKLRRHDEALACFEHALALQPDHAKAALALGLSLSNLNRHEAAFAAYGRAASLDPANAEAWYFLATAALETGRNADALAHFDRALALKPHHIEALRLKALALARLDRAEEALAAIAQALKRAPARADLESESADLLMRLNRHADALAAYERALHLKPTPESLYGRANALSILKRHEEAIAACETLLARDPHYRYARGIKLHSQMQICDWRGFTQEKALVAADIEASRHVISPFNLKALSGDPELHLKCSRLMIAHQYKAREPLWQGAVRRHRRPRIAYVSGEFGNTVVATQMAGVFEHHDRSRFEIFAFSFGPDRSSPMRSRLEAAFEHFHDVAGRSDAAIAQALAENEIDIAIDLMGFTGECRPGIFAYRPTPVAVNFLGFPGTMGADVFDYIVADEIVIPKEQHSFYQEKVVTLPVCYLPHDATRRPAAQTPSRGEAGLPETGFVFCSFNAGYKLTPEMFAVWMRLLGAVENSVLWLAGMNESARRNLGRAAEAQGISPARLIFAPLVPVPEDHLARLSLADLFLDTLPYNAHATAGDALAAGVPLVTLKGESFAGRVAASQLFSIGLPELIVESLDRYEALALELARDPAQLSALRAKLARNRDIFPLFDTAGFTRHLEAAYTGMMERYWNGLPPARFSVGDAL